jgi:hypothetical protein
MPEVRIVSSNDKVKKRFPSTVSPEDQVGLKALLDYWSDKLGLKNARIEVYDRACRCRRRFPPRHK